VPDADFPAFRRERPTIAPLQHFSVLMKHLHCVLQTRYVLGFRLDARFHTVTLGVGLPRVRTTRWREYARACFRFGSANTQRRSQSDGYSFFGRSNGNKITSRMDSAPVSSIVSRSIPRPKPPAGGMPCSSASKNSSSIFCFSSPACSSRR
jgi:hypothetical protein